MVLVYPIIFPSKVVQDFFHSHYVHFSISWTNRLGTIVGFPPIVQCWDWLFQVPRDPSIIRRFAWLRCSADVHLCQWLTILLVMARFFLSYTSQFLAMVPSFQLSTCHFIHTYGPMVYLKNLHKIMIIMHKFEIQHDTNISQLQNCSILPWSLPTTQLRG